MSDLGTQEPTEQPSVKWPSVDDSKPAEEGGPTARIGFNYQDEIAVGFLIEMLETQSIIKVHCETHDDILIVRAPAGTSERIAGALKIGERLTDDVRAVEAKIKPLQEAVEEVARATDFDAAAVELEDGMNAYLNAISELRPKVWRHSSISIDVSRSSFAIRVGKRRWQAALGGTDTLYFLMAYHYGLLSLSGKLGYHYPGLSVIDVPAEFSGEAVEDKENFIVQPFIELLKRNEYNDAQLLITGASFVGLEGAHRRQLKHVFTA